MGKQKANTDDREILLQRIAELEQQLAERETALQQSQSFFQRFLDHAPMMLFINDLRGRPLFTNRPCKAFFEADQNEANSHHSPSPDRGFLLSRIANLSRNPDHEVQDTGAPLSVEDTIAYGNEQRIYTTIKFPIYDAEGRISAIGGIATDITESRRAEQALRENEEQYRSERDFAESLIETAQVIILVLDSDGRIVRFNPYMEALSGYSQEEVQGADWFSTFIPERKRETIRSLFVQAINNMQVRGYVNPIVTRNGEEYEIEWYAKTLQDTNERTTGLLAIGLDITERVRHEREREAVISVASALRIATTRAEIVPVLLQQVMGLLHTENAALFTRNPDTGEVVLEHGCGSLAKMTGRRLLPGEGIIGRVISSKQPYFTNDIAHDPNLAWKDLPETLESLVCVPLMSHGQVNGTLCVGNSSGMSQDAVRLLNAIGDMAANALYRTSLHEQTQRRLKHIQALHMIDRTMTTSLDLHTTLTILLDQVATQLQVDAAVVLIFNSVSQTLEYAADRGFHSPFIQRTLLYPGEGYAGRAALERRIINIPDISRQMDERRDWLHTDEGFRTYYGVPLIAREQVKGVLEIFHRVPLSPDQEWLDFMAILAGQAAIAIEHAELFAELQRTNDELLLAYDTTIEGLARALELRDAETQGHCRRVTRLTMQLARAMHFSGEELVHIRRGALLHDVGKIAIPDAILLKPGPLTESEYAIMQLHTTYAYDMLYPIPFLRPALDIPYCHHEKWNGTGYPRGLAGEQIPLPARLFAVVDVYDALSSDRPYRPAWSLERVRNYLEEQTGTHFDPRVVEAFLKHVVSDMLVGDDDISPVSQYISS